MATENQAMAAEIERLRAQLAALENPDASKYVFTISILSIHLRVSQSLPEECRKPRRETIFFYCIQWNKHIILYLAFRSIFSINVLANAI